MDTMQTMKISLLIHLVFVVVVGRDDQPVQQAVDLLYKRVLNDEMLPTSSRWVISACTRFFFHFFLFLLMKDDNVFPPEGASGGCADGAIIIIEKHHQSKPVNRSKLVILLYLYVGVKHLHE
ncbi:hypothetical protein BDA99DRAFT_537429 [Phascolomyces articulosus]|uniref:Secreted protein n=1 Tax=Phascolomyces articulosus TaxID=60185 RepID=A0AAD5PEE4_9FUNG|nr:hypothetical protein BDA99DRAFT_537429 [Phascolomyces articulosus]